VNGGAPLDIGVVDWWAGRPGTTGCGRPARARWSVDMRALRYGIATFIGTTAVVAFGVAVIWLIGVPDATRWWGLLVAALSVVVFLVCVRVADRSRRRDPHEPAVRRPAGGARVRSAPRGAKRRGVPGLRSGRPPQPADESSAEPTVFRASVTRLVVLLLGSLAFVATGVFLLADADVGVFGATASVAALAVFGGSALAFLWRLIRRPVALVIDDEGFTDRVFGRVRWSEVAFVAPYRFEHQGFVGVALHDLAAYQARAPRLRARLSQVNSRMGFAGIDIGTVALSVSPQEVIAAMQRHHPALVVGVPDAEPGGGR
jgi:hypothetical protein